jgi:MFS family permease
MATGYVAADHGLRPAPFYLGIAFAALGLGVSALFVHETREYARLEAINHVTRADGRHDHLGDDLSDGEVFRQTSFREPALSAASQAGLVNNLNDGLAWGLFPGLFLSAGLSIERIGLLAATYPMVWGLGQLVTGGLSDRWGRKWLITAGMTLQAVGLGVMATAGNFAWWFVAAVLLGAGTAMVYPTLLAAVGDVAHPAWRARAVGTYRLWRDGGFAVGALLAGILADLYGVRTAVGAVAALTALSGVIVAVRMYETRPAQARSRSAVTGGSE